MRKYIAFYPIILSIFLFCNSFVSQSFAMSKSPLVPRLDLAKLNKFLPSPNGFVPLLNPNKLELNPVSEFVEACQAHDILKLNHCLEKYSEDLNFLKDPGAFKAFWDTVESEAFSDLKKDDGSRVFFAKEFLSEKNKHAVNFLMSSLQAKNETFQIVFLSLCINRCYEMLEVILSNSEIVNLLPRDLISSAIFLMLKSKWKEGIKLFRKNIRGRTMLRNNLLHKLKKAV